MLPMEDLLLWDILWYSLVLMVVTMHGCDYGGGSGATNDDGGSGGNV